MSMTTITAGGGLIKSPIDVRDYIYSNVLNQSGISVLSVDSTPLLNIDNRKYLADVRSQYQRETCVGFATSAMIESNINKNTGKINYYMSPEFIYDNRINKDQDSMYLRDAMNILLNLGISTEQVCPYQKTNNNYVPTQYAMTQALQFKIQSYASIKTIDEMKHAIYNEGSCIVALPFYNNSSTFWKPASSTENVTGGHAVLFCGYDDTARHFILRNSWGDLWNFPMMGYAYFSYDDFPCMWEAWTCVSPSLTQEQQNTITTTNASVKSSNCGCNIC